MNTFERMLLKARVIPITVIALLHIGFLYHRQGKLHGSILFACCIIAIITFIVCRAVIITKHNCRGRRYVHVIIDTLLFVTGCIMSCCFVKSGGSSSSYWTWVLFAAPFFGLNRVAVRQNKQ